LVVLVLNPAELFAQSRDSERLGDMATLQRAINFWVSTAASSSLLGTETRAEGSATCDFQVNTGCPLSAATNVFTTNSYAGWVPLQLSDATGGAPIARLPKDPTDSATYHYTYRQGTQNNQGVYEIDNRLESNKYRGQMINDGGDQNSCGTDFGTTSATQHTCWYEVGTALNL